MKKIIALVLALVMTLSLGTVAFASSTHIGVPGEIREKDYERLETVSNLTARILQLPAYMLGTAMNYSKNLTVNAVNAWAPVAYNTAEAASKALTASVDIFCATVGKSIVAAKEAALSKAEQKASDLYAEGYDVYGDYGGKDWTAYDYDLDSRYEGATEQQWHDYLALRDEWSAARDAASEASHALEAAKEFNKGLSDMANNRHNIIFEGAMGNAVSWAYDVLDNNSGTIIVNPGHFDDIEPRYIVGGDAKTSDKGEKDKLNKTVISPVTYMIAKTIVNLDKMVGQNVPIYNLTLEELVTPGAWAENEMFRLNYTKFNAGFDETKSYIANVVGNNIKDMVNFLTKNSTFQAMNGSYDGKLPSEAFEEGVYGENYQPGGELAEALFRMGYNWMHRNYGDFEPWNGFVPSIGERK